MQEGCRSAWPGFLLERQLTKKAPCFTSEGSACRHISSAHRAASHPLQPRLLLRLNPPASPMPLTSHHYVPSHPCVPSSLVDVVCDHRGHIHEEHAVAHADGPRCCAPPAVMHGGSSAHHRESGRGASHMCAGPCAVQLCLEGPWFVGQQQPRNAKLLAIRILC